MDNAVRAHAKHHVVVRIVEVNVAPRVDGNPRDQPQSRIEGGLTVAGELSVSPGESSDDSLRPGESETSQPKRAEGK